MNFKTITFATLALFLSGTNAKGTKLNELKNKMPSAANATQTKLSGQNILSDDPLVDEQNEFLDFVEFAQ